MSCARPTVLAVALGLAVGAWSAQHGLAGPVAALAFIALGVVQLSEQQRQHSAAMIREALRRADIGIRKAALYMDMDPSDFERALTGVRKLDWWRLEMLPRAFWVELWPLIAEDKGVPAIFRTFLRILPALTDERPA